MGDLIGLGPPKNEAARRSRDGEARPEEFDNGDIQVHSETKLRQQAIRTLRRQHAVERICQIPRLVAELLDEIDRYYGLGEDLDYRLDRYADLDPTILRLLGADRFPERPFALCWGRAMIRAAINGRLGGDPAQRATRTGKPMVTASAAGDVAKPGEEPVTEWISIVGFGAVAELLARHAKGDLISTIGSITRSTFTQDGQERSSWSLLAESVLSARTAGNGRPRTTRQQSARSAGYSFYSPPRQSAPHSRAGLPDDWVSDLWMGSVP